MTPEQIEKERAKFEAHFNQSPYEWHLTRCPEAALVPWAGNYYPYNHQCAWEAWLARAEQDQALRDAVAEVVKRWDSPQWKWDIHTGDFINKMRDLL
jgi:hypothetical protein